LSLEFYNSGTNPMIFQQEKLLWMLRFGFVSGHDFSRAVKDRKSIGLQPLLRRIRDEMLVRRQAKKKAQGLLKAQIFVGPQRPD